MSTVGKNIRVIQTIPNDSGAANVGVITGETTGSEIGIADPDAGSKATALAAGYGLQPVLNEDTGDINYILTART